VNRIIRMAVVMLTALLVAACVRNEQTATGDVHTHHAAAPGADAATSVAPAPASDLSIYQLESEWTDQHGRTRQLAELRGRPQAIAMVYTHCGSACPRIVGDLKRLEAEFPELGLVLVSIDPERDSPGRLHEFATGSGLGERWTLLNGDDGALMELAAVLGVRYRRVSDTEFMHSNLITVLDTAGVIAYRQEGLGEAPRTIAALREQPQLQ